MTMYLMTDEQKTTEEQEATTTPHDTTDVAVAPATEEAPVEQIVASAVPKVERAGAKVPTARDWDPRPGQVVRVHVRITETTKKGQEKERVQVFEGTVIARRHGGEAGGTFTVRKVAKGGFGVERIFPLHTPTVTNVEVVKEYRVRRAKLHYLRERLKKGKKLRETTA